MSKFSREMVDITFANMFSNKSYTKDYIFYAHMIAQCNIILTDSVDIAAVNFSITKYNLFINPLAFEKMELLERMGVLKHEMFHILYNHIGRKDGRVHELFNVVADCAINQFITREHLPGGAIYPDTLEAELTKEGYKVKVPKGLSAEQYYDLLPQDLVKKAKENEENGDGGEPQDCPDCDGSGEGEDGKECESCGGSGKEGKGNKPYTGLWKDNPLDDHSKWGDSKGEKDLKVDITKRMVNKAIEKSRGNVPSELSDILDIWNKPPQVSWKKVLHNIASNKKANKIQTIMKKSRRFPNRPEIRGHKKDREFDIVVVLDVSGSMSEKEIVTGLNEIKEVARLTSSTVKIIQVDTEVHSVDDFDPKKFTRSAGDGTEMLPAFKYIKENKIKMDACILISDMYIEDIDYWKKEKVNPKCKMIFLATEDRMPDLGGYPNYIGFNLKDA